MPCYNSTTELLLIVAGARRDLSRAQTLLRLVVKARCGRVRDWLRMLPSLLQLLLFAAIVAGIDRRHRNAPS